MTHEVKEATAMVVGSLLPIIVASLVRKGSERAYTHLRGEDAPEAPRDTPTPWKHALLYAGLSGAVGGVIKLMTKELEPRRLREARSGDHSPF